jgi:hypothetical protein
MSKPPLKQAIHQTLFGARVSTGEDRQHNMSIVSDVLLNGSGITLQVSVIVAPFRHRFPEGIP